MDKSLKLKKSILYTFLEITATLVLTMMASMWDWVNMEFTFERIMTAKYWENVFMQTAMFSCALIIGTLGRLEREELNNAAYDMMLDSYHLKLESTNMKDSVTKVFTGYIDNVYNPEIKKSFLRKKYALKLHRQERFSLDRWKLDFNRYNKLTTAEEKEAYRFRSPLSKHYMKRRLMLEELASDEYIEENWQYMFVLYPKVNSFAFTWYVNIKASQCGIYKVENKAGRDIFLKVARKFFYAFLSGVILGLLLINPDSNELAKQANGWIAIMLQYIYRVSMIVFNLIMGVFTGKQLFNENNMLPISNRIRILDEYKLWLDVHPVQELGVEQIKKQLEESLRKEYDVKLENAKKDAIAVVEKFNKEQTKGVA